jgi:prepilin-type N-terminal cleavage/methylation domain-containing protein/prepilin-type processing-associated H-X9-DG protein
MSHCPSFPLTPPDATPPRSSPASFRSTLLRGTAFTLIELLVVIAIIALLIGLLVPSLSKVRNEARTLKCATALRSVAQSVAMYCGDSGFFPPSYVYANSETGEDWRVEDQILTNPNQANGYVHWSWSLFNSGYVNQDSFKCPAMLHGGAPAANPGSDPDDWEPGQVNDLGNAPGAPTPHDRQARRMAYTGNAAIFPRNKFTASDGLRKNRLVKQAWIDQSKSGGSRTILATEFLDTGSNWESLSVGGIIKSHRPITPFIGGSSGSDVYAEPDLGSTPRFFYPAESSIRPLSQLGAGMIEDANSILNAVGRQHPGGDRVYGGTANFSYVDAHVERSTVLESIKQKRWGDKFYSLTGNNITVGTQ